MPDFEPEGSLALKPWFGSDAGLELPAKLALPVVDALAPYDAQIAQVNRQIGSVPPRQTMKDASGASQMDAKTQVSSLHGMSMLHAATQPFESLVKLALLHEPGGDNDRKLIATAIAAHVNLHATPELAAAQAAREAGNAPNAVLAAAAAILGPRRQQRAREAACLMIDRFAAAKLKNAQDDAFDIADRSTATRGATLVRDAPDPRAEAMLAGVDGAPREVGAGALVDLAAGPSERRGRAGRDHHDAGLGAAVAQAHLAPDGRKPAVVDAAVRHADRRFGRRIASRAGTLLRHREHEPASSAAWPRSPSPRFWAACRVRTTCSPSRRWSACC